MTHITHIYGRSRLNANGGVGWGGSLNSSGCSPRARNMTILHPAIINVEEVYELILIILDGIIFIPAIAYNQLLKAD
jgi:hypothetical protein